MDDGVVGGPVCSPAPTSPTPSPMPTVSDPYDLVPCCLDCIMVDPTSIRSRSRRLLRLVMGIAALVLLGACGDETLFDINRGNPVIIRITSDTTGLSPGAPGDEFTVEVRLIDAQGRAVPDWPVIWRARSAFETLDAPQGRVSPDTADTDADGVARASWTVGDSTGTYFLDVRAANVARASQQGTFSPVSPEVECEADLDPPNCPDLTVRVQ